MTRPITLTGVVRGRTITLDEAAALPDGYRVTLHVILTPEQAVELSFGSWAGLSPAQAEDLERVLSEASGEVFRLPEMDDES